MADETRRSGRLTAMELAAIDFMITTLQAAGHTIGDVAKDDNPREQWADGWLQAHHPFVDLGEHDREIIRQIKQLAGQLSSRVSLTQLIEARGKILQGR